LTYSSEKKKTIYFRFILQPISQFEVNSWKIKALADSAVDMIEIGNLFLSDSSGDGPVIQRSNEKALKNGMSLNLLFRH